MFVPILEINNKSLVLQNFLMLSDESSDKSSKVKATAKNGVMLEFVDEDADEMLEQIENLLSLSDAMQLPIVGVNNQLLILFNFLLVEDVSEGTDTKVILTDDCGNDLEFFDTDAALIISRIDTLAQGTKSLLDQMQLKAVN